MVHQRIWRQSLLGLVLLVLVACGGGGKLAITQAILAKDSNGSRSTTVFAPADPVYLLVDLSGPEDTRVKATWIAVNAENTTANYLVDESEQSLGSSSRLTFDLPTGAPLPNGEYRVDVSLNGEVSQSITFRIQPPLGQAAPTPAATAESDVPAPVATTAAKPEVASGAVASLDAVKSATIQIQAEGSFVDPEVGLMLNAAGRGSGFIIDPSGIAVTNNHVVTGAALLKVWVGGETQPRNARILGVSECSDLAVIDIDGEGYPYLSWYEGDLPVGLDVYAAGFPLGDPEFTLTKGIISKARASGETNWASVDTVLEHDATINPGNSGGPLVSTGGQVVGVNYAGSNEVNQYFAIARNEAKPLIEQLRAGQDVTSIGINGQAVSDGESIWGVWVSSVKSGSPADRSGIQAGDILTTMEGLVLATDGTMADYCDILRTHLPSDTLNIEVLRFNTQEVLAGQLNGRELAQTYSFAQNLENEVPDTPANPGGGDTPAGYASYATITDDTGTLAVEVPATWTDIDGGPWQIEGTTIGQQVAASPDLDGFYSSWNVPGLIFAVSPDLASAFSEQELLDAFDFSSECTYGGREAYGDELYSGYYDVWASCGGTDTLYLVVAAEPESGNQTLLVQVQVVTDADLEALDHILASFVAGG